MAENGFTMIPDTIAERTDVSILAKCIFGYMVRKARKGSWRGGMRLLAKHWGIGHSQVCRAILELERADLIHANRRGRGHRSSYDIGEIHLKVSHIATLSDSKSVPHSHAVSHIATQVDHIATRKRQRPSESKKEISISEQTEQLWKAYPKRVGKLAAMRAIKAALKVGDFDTIMAGVKRYAAAVVDADPHYTKHPQGWFSAGRWADEVLPGKPETRPGIVRAPPGKYDD